MMYQVSGLVAVLQDPAIDVLLLDLRDEDDFLLYRVSGGMSTKPPLIQSHPTVL